MYLASLLASLFTFNFQSLQDFSNDEVITVRNEVAKVMFSQVSVCPQGRGCLLWGVPGLGRGLFPGGCPSMHWTPPRERRPLRTVRILLECILVHKSMHTKNIKVTNVSVRLSVCPYVLNETTWFQNEVHYLMTRLRTWWDDTPNEGGWAS